MATWRKEYSRYQKYFLNVVSLYKRRQDLRMFLEIILSLVTISFFALFAIRPTFVTVSDLLNQIRTKEDILAQMETKIRNLTQAQINFNAQSQRLALLETAIPDSPSPESFIRQVEGVSRRDGVSVLGATTGEVTLTGTQGKTKADEELEALPEGADGVVVSVTTTGNYENLVAYLSEFESLRRPLWLDLFSLNLVDSDEGARIILSITGRAPYFKQ